MARDAFPEHLLSMREAFRRSVCEDPGDLATRLIVADWMEEQGDSARAELIRVQCQLAGELDTSADVDTLRDREDQLLRAHVRRWNGELHRMLSRTPLVGQVDSRRGRIRRWSYGRGFVERIHMDAAAFVEHAELIFQLGPIRWVQLWGARGCLRELARCPWLERLETLDLQKNRLERQDLRTLAASRHLDRLAYLNLADNPAVTSNDLQLFAAQQAHGLVVLF